MDVIDEKEKFNEWLVENGIEKNGLVIAKLAVFFRILKLILISCLNTSKFNQDSQKIKLEILNQIDQSPLEQLLRGIPTGTFPSQNEIQKFIENIRCGKENLGKIYSSILSQKERRKMGQFWTPDYIADFMVSWALRTKTDTVLDPGTGPAIFLRRVINRFCELGQPKETMHKQIFGIEKSELLYLIGIVNLATISPNFSRSIIIGDYLLIYPPNRTTLFQSEETPFPNGAFSFDAIVFNPPYTRHHLLPQVYKNKLLPALNKKFNVRISRLSSLFVYFILHSLGFLKNGGRMAFITPTIVFEARTSNALKEALRKNTLIRSIIVFSEELHVFPGVDTAACITLLEKIKPHDGQVILIEIRKWPGTKTIIQALEEENEGEEKWGTIKKIPTELLKNDVHWTTLFNKLSVSDSPKWIKLGDVAHVLRGIATGANKFFTLTDDEVTSEGFKLEYLRPVLSKTRYAQRFVFDNSDMEKLSKAGRKRWLLYFKEEDVPRSKELAEYIQKGEAAGLQNRSLVKTRKKWFLMERREVPSILYTYLSRARSRFIYNKAKVLALNVFLMIYPLSKINSDETTLKSLLAILNSSITRVMLRHVGRSYGGDTLKIEPRQLEQLEILDPRQLKQEQRIKLAELFDQLVRTTHISEENSIKEEIDLLIKKYS